ncbi:Potassium/sodium hyperpolarization-activated cyclic nucleotide-gated channel 4 [Eufriesea mexicana]|uniref:Potassium/sodium hyperpolarization-activated cyclic nucleotide-gated channel 4 n=1 Tax=Eufriesea mexicana TaxID=516756 RepID=A0A310SKP2_9HYME|nr:Potassium/sodium hyperpolarization-activated cyclic nucleotide-gated channel 4 [Eufriesea mexicana]
MKEHTCGLEHSKLDPHGSRINMNDITCKESWMYMLQINENTPRAKMYFDSKSRVFAERRRHASSEHWWVIHPFSTWRFLWDLLMTVVYLVSFLTIPFSVCFVVMSHDDVLLDEVNILIYTFCWFDIIGNFFTGYYDKTQQRVILSPLKIFIRYLKSYLILDILSSLPWDHITLPWRRVPGEDSHYLIVLINLLPCLKLARYSYVNLQIFELFTHFEIMHFYYEMLTIFLIGFYMIYWAACLCYSMQVLVLHFTNTSPKDCPECWMTGLNKGQIAIRFQYALFIVVEKLAASGYGDYVPRTEGHIILSSVLVIIGRALESYIAVMLIQIKAGRKASKAKFQEIINQLSAYTRQKQLPKHMRIRLVAYYYYRFRNSYFREKSILRNLSEKLRQEIAFQSSHRLVENVSIFKALPKSTLQSIVKNLKFELFLPNDVIVKAGAHGDCMFFLSAGTVAVLTPTGKEVHGMYISMRDEDLLGRPKRLPLNEAVNGVVIERRVEPRNRGPALKV